MSEIEYKREPTKKQLDAWAKRDAKRKAAATARYVRLTGYNYATKAVYVMHRVSLMQRGRTRCGMKMKGITGVEWFEELPVGVSTLYCTHKGCFPDHLKPV